MIKYALCLCLRALSSRRGVVTYNCLNNGIMGKAKRKSISSLAQGATAAPLPSPVTTAQARKNQPPTKRRASQRKQSLATASMNPDSNADILDGPVALRASPDAEEKDESLDMKKAGIDVDKQVKDENEEGKSDSSLSDLSDLESPVKVAADTKKSGKGHSESNGVQPVPKKSTIAAKSPKEGNKEPQFLDPEADGDEEAGEDEIQEALSRPPPVNSDYLPLPWKGRLGYV